MTQWPMKFYMLCIITLLMQYPLSAKESCILIKPSTAYGLPGTYTVQKDSIETSLGLRRSLYIYSPVGAPGKVPCVVLFPQYGNNHPEEYEGLIQYLVSKGVLVLFPPYRPLNFRREQLEKPAVSFELFKEIMVPVIDKIDTTRMGFVGHGLGGGLIPAMAKQVVEKMKWGTNGTFMYIMSPWYFHGITKRELQTFPKTVSCIIQVYENDNINDPRIASTLFNDLGIGKENKAFYLLKDNNRVGCRLTSDFAVPLSREAIGGEDNMLDTLGIYRLCDAAIAGVFHNDTASYAFVFGGKETRSLSIGQWLDSSFVAPMVVTDSADQYLFKKPFINTWISARNPYIDDSRFRKARKIYFEHTFRKILNLARFVVDTKKAEKDTSQAIDIFENPIDSGYGSPGLYTMIMDSVKNPLNDENDVRFFYPASAEKPFPVIIFLHGYSGPDYLYFEPLITHIVSKGYAILYPPYPSLPLATSEKRVLEKIAIIKAGVDTGIKTFRAFMDSTKIAIVGQSFGGGQVPTVAYSMLTEKKWGAKGTLLFMMAPWFSFAITQKQLQSFPPNVKLVMQVYDDDLTNDHQMAIDIFRTINIPKEEKDYIILYSDSFEGYTMQANHFVPYGNKNIYGSEDLLDYYGVYRPFDALADYVFNGNVSAKNVALGNGSPDQIFMGEWGKDRPVHPMKETDNPEVYHSEYQYFYAWDNPLNPRREFQGARKKGKTKRNVNAQGSK